LLATPKIISGSNCIQAVIYGISDPHGEEKKKEEKLGYFVILT